VTARSSGAAVAEPSVTEERAPVEVGRGRTSRLVPWLVLAAILIAGALLRLWQVDRVGLNSDEAVYVGQGASIAGDPTLSSLFPIYRAHPLLFQTVLSVVFDFSNADHDVSGRIAAAVVGLGTVLLTYEVGRLLYGRRAGLFAALFMAVMPYCVLVSRQALLDGPEAFFATLALYLTARYALTQRPAWLYAAAGTLGLTFLCKEVGLLFVGSVYAFFALTPSVHVRLRHAAVAALVMAVVISPYPLSLLFAGATGTGGQFLSYQIFRRPNHDLLFYPATVTEALGPLLVVVALLGLWALRRRGSWRETLLLSWVVVPALFFEVWPVKGFQYLLPIAPPLAILTGRALSHGLGSRRVFRVSAAWAGTAILAITLAVPAWNRIQPPRSGTFLAGSGGVAGGREAGEWIRRNITEGGVLLAIGPSMANILQFYGHRKTHGLSVSPNPLHRNPVYKPVRNPDLQLREGNLQHLVWDSYSARRSPFFADKIRRYAERYHGRVVHVQSVPVTAEDGRQVDKPVIVIYAVQP
jgi:4-amino-4-deoxy-L-arabinose transferase-like glycosyltransferase